MISDDLDSNHSLDDNSLGFGQSEEIAYNASIPNRQPVQTLTKSPKTSDSGTQTDKNYISTNAPALSTENTIPIQHDEVHTDLSTNQNSNGSAEESESSSASCFSSFFSRKLKSKKGL